MELFFIVNSGRSKSSGKKEASQMINEKRSGFGCLTGFGFLTYWSNLASASSSFIFPVLSEQKCEGHLETEVKWHFEPVRLGLDLRCLKISLSRGKVRRGHWLTQLYPYIAFCIAS